VSESNSICSVDGCDNACTQRRKGGICEGHYRRLLRTGSTDGMQKRAKRGEPLHFLESLRTVNTDDCVIWPYCISHDGYAKIEYGGRQRFVSNIVLEWSSKRPEEHEAAHNCGESKCVNPKHLRWDTHANNMADREKHGTVKRLFGERHGLSRLTNKQVLEIRRLYATRKYTQREIGCMFGYSQSAIQRIVTGASWPHLSRH